MRKLTHTNTHFIVRKVIQPQRKAGAWAKPSIPYIYIYIYIYIISPWLLAKLQPFFTHKRASEEGKGQTPGGCVYVGIVVPPTEPICIGDVWSLGNFIFVTFDQT